MATRKPNTRFSDRSFQIPPSVTSLETSIAAFIGYTEKAEKDGETLLNVPTRISSYAEFIEYFGGRFYPDSIEVILDLNNNYSVVSVKPNKRFLLYDSLRLFFDNGGSDCYIVSVGLFDSERIKLGDALNPSEHPGLKVGLAALENCDEPAIILFPDAVFLESSEFYGLQQSAVAHCVKTRNRFAILDLREHAFNNLTEAVEDFRNNFAVGHPKYAAAYTPWLVGLYPITVKYNQFSKSLIDSNGNPINDLSILSSDPILNELIRVLENTFTDASGNIVSNEMKKYQEVLFERHPVIKEIVRSIKHELNYLPPSGAIAGIFARVDKERGVWKAPANEGVNAIVGPKEEITTSFQEELNVDPVGGKFINAIRTFVGKGTLVWGARTLAGNDNEWRYISVSRFVSMVEESCKVAIKAFTSQPNDANTWTMIEGMLLNYLITLWRAGALQGTKPEHAFYVSVGLGRTMTAQDIIEGKLKVEFGLAVLRPAEFIVCRINVEMIENQ